MELKQVLLDQRTRLERRLESEKLIERDVPDLERYLVSPNVLAILGVRRSGKSTLAKMIVRGSNYGYVNFDDERLYWLKMEDLSQVERALYELFGEVEYLVFDEIQNVTGWELFVNRLREEGRKVILTGSNSKLLSGELATHLTGRHIDFTLFPFSFPEYLRYRGVKPERMRDVYTSLSEATLKKELENYIRLGGFPEVHKISEEIIHQIVSDIFAKDIVYRIRVKRIRTFHDFAFSVMKYYANEISLNRISKMLKLSINTVEEWFDAMISSHLILPCERYSESQKTALVSPKKLYLVDPGIISLVLLDRSMGRIMENLVALHLARRKIKLQYYREEGKEVDFVTPDSFIQVTYANGKDEIPEREIENLKSVRGKRKILVTWDYEDEIDGIKLIPLWKFLLE
ncbi:ATP-binding protein [Metallosphaera javensis (ex Sakai et al. 2022)]|uniref:ATP-binding protein n=1 Tax=Metallosphaera javensis (ex Sakai et al. 2022) TaxID=2775498 RepID=UPI002585FCBA|nr:MAG: ATPase AAA [Metallosphaera javensis (ex Sakai et al. 2022)]